jgi:predicted ester cyclase
MYQVLDATAELKHLTVDGDSGAAELMFFGKHIGHFNGVSATGKSINMPYMAQFDMAGGRISALRIYMSLDEVMRQIQS